MRSTNAALLAWLAAAVCSGCQVELDELDGIFYSGDHRAVHCAVNLDSSANTPLPSVDRALVRAAERGEVVELYAHNPGGTVPISVIEHVLANARDRGLAFVTYTDFARGEGTGPGLALSFDDTSVRAWSALRPLFRQYGARLTFFVSRYSALSDEERALLHELAADGHDIEPHTVNHLHAPRYVEDHGLAAYLRDEVQPSIDVLEADGYVVSAFAYPFGAHTHEIDDALRKRLPILRSVEFAYAGVSSPCAN